ncbi:DUF885 domain-containing protein [Amycolatopsis jejuensis]|uniref:DUF885 domain-containing protein n=1 Tax=Amycolatopsis jejuensis TaxID=330084 RepID=UPI00068A2403|nr:DUF885 domain-containing protein [Amycolatopsis jejuensis]
MTLADIADDLLGLTVEWDPFLCSAVGIPDAAGLVPDLSDDGQARLRDGFASASRELQRIDPASLSSEDRLTWQMATWQSRLWTSIVDSRREEFTVSPYKAWSLPTAITSVMPKALSDPDAFHSRCASLAGALGQAQDALRRGAARGRTPVRRLVEGVTALLDDLFAAGGPEKTLEGNGTAETREVLASSVRPALGEFREFLATELAPLARPDDRPGLCWIPGGEEAYQASVAEHTTTSLTPAEVHELGRETVAALASEARPLAQAVFGTEDLAEVVTRLRDDPALRFDSPAELLAAAVESFHRGQSVVDSFIGTLPVTRCEVKPMPDLEAARMMQAYYRPGDSTVDRPGIFWVNTNISRGATRYELETLVAHESVPGHHVQWSMAREVPHCRYRSLVPTTAFIEGWALYCEQEADELGLFTSDLSRLGKWSSQSWRAARLVVDTGLHAMGWTRAQAVEYLLTHTATSPANAEGEVDRYIGNPGQALAYTTGVLELRRLRQEAESRMGARFDRREFHDRLLAHGSPPLPLVRTAIEEWMGTA